MSDRKPGVRVRFLDLERLHAPMRDALRDAVDSVAAASAFAGGPWVEAFEKDFAEYCGVPHAVGVGSGTEALWFALLALGIGPGDEVITAPNSFVATAEAVRWAGAEPVFADVLDTTFNLDPEDVARRITGRTRAILPVHLFGQSADLEAIGAIAGAHGLPVVEDASQAHGATFLGRRVGSIGAAGCFSFYPGKNLGAWGEAGAVVTSDPDLAERVRWLRNHGRGPGGAHVVSGWNGRMDGIQAAVLRLKLRHLDDWNARRARNADYYRKNLGAVPGVRLPGGDPRAGHVYHHFVVRVNARDAVLRGMAEAGVECGIHYPVPIHRQPAFADANGTGFPVAERLAGEILSLPVGPELKDEERDAVVEALAGVLDGMRRGDREESVV